MAKRSTHEDDLRKTLAREASGESKPDYSWQDDLPELPRDDSAKAVTAEFFKRAPVVVD